MLDLFLEHVYTNQVMRYLIMQLLGDSSKRVWPLLLMTGRRRSETSQTLHEKMMKSIHDIYARDETFIDSFAHDLDDCAVWFNESEFARFHMIGNKKVLSIFTKYAVSQAIAYRAGRLDNPEGITKAGGTLYCRVHDIKGNFTAGSQLKLDGKLYTILDASIIQDQVWRVTLEANK